MKQQIFTTLAICSVLSVSFASVKPLKTDKDKLSYALGVFTGRSFNSHSIDIDPKVYARGLESGLNGTPSALTDDEMNTIIQNFQRKDQQKAKEARESAAKINLEKGQDFLKKNSEKEGVVTLASGLQYKIIKEGKGEHPGASDIVVVNYKGQLIDGTVFDSSFQRNQAATFPVNAVIQGWQDILPLMQTGAVWEVYVPAQLAYGDQNYPPMIGPNQTLIFTIELISIKK